MKDDLTDRMAATFEANGMPVALKVSDRTTRPPRPPRLHRYARKEVRLIKACRYQYIAYGSLSEVMPFLGRRAIENKSVMSGEGGAAAERQRLASELWRRWFGRA
jgi:proline dehydrogenase